MNTESGELLNDVKRLLSEIEEDKRQARKTGITYTCGVLVVVVCFGFALWGKIQSNFSNHAIESAFNSRVAQLQPILEHNMDRIFRGVPESYQAAFVEKMHATLPKLKNASLAETQTLVDNITKRFERQLNEAVSAKLFEKNNEFMQAYLQSGEKASKNWNVTRKRLERELTAMTNEAAKRMRANYQGDIQRLLATTRSFPRADAASVLEETSAKLFMRYWVETLDKFNHELRVGGIQ